ncbi:MAG: DUF4345 domain-containing protein [Pseudomonadota bacterium]
MRKWLEYFVIFFGSVCCLIALAHIALGPKSIPGAIPVNATMDSEDRFYATLFLGFGIALIWCARALHEAERIRVFGFLLAVFFFSGVARIISWAMVGPPIALFIFLMFVELLLPPLLWWWHKATLSAQR